MYADQRNCGTEKWGGAEPGGEGKCSLAEVINTAEIQCREQTSSSGFAWLITSRNTGLWIGHFRISLNLFLKTSLGAHLSYEQKTRFIHLQIKLIFIWMVVHQASLWQKGLVELWNGLLRCISFPVNFIVYYRWLNCAQCNTPASHSLWL